MDDQNNKILLIEKAKLIELKPVSSSNIGGMGYDSESKILKVAFKGKDKFNTYLYENVDESTYKNIITSESIGKALSTNIISQKEKYKYTKLN